MDLIQRIHRIRKLDEKRARVELALAERELEASQDRLGLLNTEGRSSAAVETAVHVAGEAERHRYALHVEMAKRRQSSFVAEQQHRVEERRTLLRNARRAAKTVESLADRREQVALAEREATELRRLDEAGLRSWARRVS